MTEQSFGFQGLTAREVADSRARHGANTLEESKENAWWTSLKKTLREPMLLILIAVSAIYFIHAAWSEGLFMVVAIIVVSFISMYQESRATHALQALKKYTAPKSKVIREGKAMFIKTEEIVPGDYLVSEEGTMIPADATIIQSRDFSVDESILTGESFAVQKQHDTKDNQVYQGTYVVAGQAVCVVDKTGHHTKMGQIGVRLQTIEEKPSPLEIQIQQFVKRMALAGAAVFAVIWGINLSKSHDFSDSLLKALTLAMSIVPEEIPVAFATFMALGAWRLMQLGIVVKNTKTVETLGSASIICIDKTGTITQNAMKLISVYDFRSDSIYEGDSVTQAADVITIAMWASEPTPFDPMEKALHEAYTLACKHDMRTTFDLVHEYPLSGTPPLTTHIFKNKDGKEIIAAKGAPEAIISLSGLSAEKQIATMRALERLSKKGYRVLGVGESISNGESYPKSQHEFKFMFKGLVAFYDPPKKNIKSVLQTFYNAGLDVKIITGDNSLTTQAIAHQIQFKNPSQTVTGEEVMKLSEESMQRLAGNTNIYTRMFPEAKLKVIQTLRRQEKVVAMVGDGVNDAPALKAADIGIAMGSKGSEVAKEASALILTSDDLAGMVDAIAMGRKIYSNLKKAFQYIISIHIPIVLIVLLPVLLNWSFPTVFTPVHLIFLELVMGPTCSIIFENEPLEENVMHEPPRQFSKTFFHWDELVTSMVQGLVITLGLTAVYWISLSGTASLPKTTSMIFVTLITANTLLTLVNRSFHYSILKTFRYKNNLMPIVIAVTVAMAIIFFVIKPIRNFFHLTVLSTNDLMTCIAIGFLSVLWFEIYKWAVRIKKRSGADVVSDLAH